MSSAATTGEASTQPAGPLQWICAASRLALAVVFLYAAIAKIADPADLADSIANYRLLPALLIPWLAVTLPGVELVVGVLLVLGLFTRAAATVVAAMMLAFTVALSQAFIRDLDVECGCFGGSTVADGWVLLRDAVLLAFALLIATKDRGLWSLGRIRSR